MSGGPPCDHEYVFLVGYEIRLRVQLWLADHRTETFAVALEAEWSRDDGRRVVCIDNFGGVVHRDRYSPDGGHLARHEPIFHSDDPDRAVAWATRHLTEWASRYVTEFRQQGA